MSCQFLNVFQHSKIISLKQSFPATSVPLQAMSLPCGCAAFWIKSPVSSVLLRCAQRFNSFVFSADSLKHKTHPLWLVVAQHAPLFHQPVCSLGFLRTNKTFLPPRAILGSCVLWQPGILESLTFSAGKKDKGRSFIPKMWCVKWCKCASI